MIKHVRVQSCFFMLPGVKQSGSNTFDSVMIDQSEFDVLDRGSIGISMIKEDNSNLKLPF